MDQFLQTLKDGIAIGSLYALIALGYTMVYGILKFINFAHSDVVTLGAWLSLLIAAALAKATGHAPGEPLPWWLGATVLLSAMACCGTFGFAIERLAYKPLRRAPRLNVLITAIGVSLFLQNTGQLEYLLGTRPRAITAMLPETVLLEIGRVQLRVVDAAIVGTALVMMLGLDWLVFRTRIGTAMRAVSHSPPTAALMGVPVDRVISFTFVLGSMLAATGGFLWALKYTQVNQPADTGWTLLGLKAFVAAVVGGIGNVRGAMLGGLAIGLLENFGSAYYRSSLADVYVFGVFILVLLVKPSGLLGRAVADKV